MELEQLFLSAVYLAQSVSWLDYKVMGPLANMHSASQQNQEQRNALNRSIAWSLAGHLTSKYIIFQ